MKPVGTCMTMDLSEVDRLFFPHRPDAGTADRAKRICAGCPIVVQCRESVLAGEKARGERERGVWGGLKETERPIPAVVMCQSRRHFRDEHWDFDAGRCMACYAEANARADSRKVQDRQDSRTDWWDSEPSMRELVS